MGKKGSVLIRIIISYGVLMFLSVLISIVVYYYTYAIVQGQSELSHKNLSLVIQNSCDAELRYYKNFLEVAVRKKSVQEFAKIQEYDSASAYWNDYLVRKDLGTLYHEMGINSAYCRDYFVISNRTKKIINRSNAVGYELYEQMEFPNNSEGMADLLKAVQMFDDGHAAALRSEIESCLILIEPAIGVGVSKGDAAAVIILDIAALNNRVSSMQWDGGMDWLLMDSEGNVLRDSALFKLSKGDVDEILSSSEETVSVDGCDYMVYIQESEYYGLKYALFVPEAMVNEPSKNVHLITILSLILTVLIGGFITVYFSRMHYTPLKKIVESVRSSASEQKIGNEYEFLEKTVTNIRTESYSADYKRRLMTRQFALEKLLLGEKIEEGLEEKEDFYQKFQSGRNIVLVCYEIEGNGNSSGAKLVNLDEKTKRFVIGNVISEGVEHHFEQETFEFGKRVVSIINVPDGEESLLEMLRQEVEALRDFIIQNFHFDFHTLEGALHEGLVGIHLSWLEACQADEFVDDSEGVYIKYNDIRDTSLYSYTYSFDIEKQVADMIRNGQSVRAKEIIDNVLLNHFYGKQNAVTEIQTCMIYDIFGTLLKLSEEQGLRISQLPKLNKVSAETEVTVLQAYFHGIIDNICMRHPGEKDSQHKMELSNEITAYIREHYSDPDLNISQIAYLFHMTPAWISSLYKKQVGKSILNVIKEERIQNAKRLLNDGYDVTAVSRMVGFRESTTFIRTFKNSEGVTPGQIKKR